MYYKNMTKQNAPKPEPQKPYRIRQLAVMLILLGILSGVLAIALALRKPLAKAPSAASEPTPEATRPAPDEVAKYSVAADLPKYITIPAIDMGRVRVIKLGLMKSNKIEAPANLFDAGWYKDSAKPGQKGAAFIYGHVSSDQSDGAFHDLKKLKSGDIVTITRGDNSELKYKVVKLETYLADSVPMDEVLAPVTSGQQGLNLMTCTGKVTKESGEFSERLVVYTSLVKS